MASSYPSSVDTFAFTPAAGAGVPFDDYQKIHDAIVAVETDLLNGTGWTSYSPSWTNLSVGNGTVTAKYKERGKIVVAEVRLVWGSTTSISSAGITFTLPANVATVSSALKLGQATYFDSSLSQLWAGNPQVASATAAVLYGNQAPMVQVSATSPFTWTTSDEMVFVLTYQGV